MIQDRRSDSESARGGGPAAAGPRPDADTEGSARPGGEDPEITRLRTRLTALQAATAEGTGTRSINQARDWGTDWGAPSERGRGADQGVDPGATSAERPGPGAAAGSPRSSDPPVEVEPARRRARRGPARIDPQADPVGAARTICLRLLTGQARTRAQLADALRRRGVPDAAAAQVLGRFTDVGLIDDAAFAAAWVDTRHTGRGLARRALARELKQRGVDQSLVDQAVERLDADRELDTARALVARRLQATRGLDRRARTRRLAGMLARKGYDEQLALRVVREALDQDRDTQDRHTQDPYSQGPGTPDRQLAGGRSRGWSTRGRPDTGETDIRDVADVDDAERFGLDGAETDGAGPGGSSGLRRRGERSRGAGPTRRSGLRRRTPLGGVRPPDDPPD